MKFIFITALSFFYTSILFPQKRVINDETYKSWTTLGGYDISADGKYVWYSYGARNEKRNVVIVSFDGNWRKEIHNVYNAQFVFGGKYLIFCDSIGLEIMSLKNKRIESIPKANNLTAASDKNGQWISYNLGGWIYLRNIFTGKMKIYPGAVNCWTNEKGTIWAVQTNDTLHWVNVAENHEKTILTGQLVENVYFSSVNEQLAFLASPRDSSGKFSIFYFNPGYDRAVTLVTDKTPGIQNGYTIVNDNIRFSQDGSGVLFTLQEKSVFNVNPEKMRPKVTLWHYQDAFLQSVLIKTPELYKNERLTAHVDLKSGKVIQLDSSNFILHGLLGNSFTIGAPIYNEREAYWNKPIGDYFLISCIDGSRRPIVHLSQKIEYITVSKAEKFVIWQDLENDDIYSYDISSGVTRNVKMPIVNLRRDSSVGGAASHLMVAGWLAEDKRLVLYDKYDVWLVDPSAIQEPICLTNLEGRKSRTIFRLIYNETEITQLHLGDNIILAALEEDTKRNGFFETKIGSSVLLKRSMDNCLYYLPTGFKGYLASPLKASDAKRFLLQRQSAIEAPNLVITSDFRSFLKLSDIHPQAEYNWLSVELVKWNVKPGQKRMGLLYKPENFDSKKKYPVIFNYYEYRSNELNKFLDVDLTRGNIDIPSYVSNGYLVFVPDIIQSVGCIGDNALNTVVSAADYLARRYPWVDPNKIGLQGHSFGGYETNYIVTHSNRFAAACTAAGSADLISSFGQLDGSGGARMSTYERAQGNLGTTPWEGPLVYINNSPIFGVKNVSTPLLMMHNKMDRAVPFEQAIELYLALRREKKPVWLLEYEGQEHVLNDQFGAALDFTVRTREFFDYYLRDGEMPKWLKL
ncbi:S9 family peptidase [Chitinophaga sp. CF418]|uniref:alpha/beta hydrolase family protein n=1 Tax=Chitinophaga sp. CF418 TaxID=1855287 RepID=UPI000914746D|nr:prolyl oligopeptidase family serine peptidase [Chitinophaga sp. CF418]SHN45671.1 Prolyl oligopeptidase family protein [Chitinophaga sp. CF418]